MQPSSYQEAGVRPGDEIPGLKSLLATLRKTFEYAPGARPSLDFGYFANVVPVAPNLGIAISTDGVGTKVLVAQALQKYDTIGIDCVAMNVNDIICVGARPISMVDYVAVEEADSLLLAELAKGLDQGAREAGVSIPGGELAQVREMVRGDRPGAAFDLVGAAIGTVPLDRIITGGDLKDGDRVIGLGSSGVHSNGLTLARKAFPDLREYIPELSTSIGAALLQPTTIYVKAAMAMLEGGLAVKAFAHITGEGFFNLARVQAEVSFDITDLPATPAVFSVIQRRAEVPVEEMYQVFNMGVGFAAIVDEADEERALSVAADRGYSAATIGRIIEEPGRRIYLRRQGLVGERGAFRKA